MLRLLFCTVLAVLTSAVPAHAGSIPVVVVSIKPIHSLVAGVMGAVGEPRLLVAGTASPHIYQMRPSDAEALRRADLIVWIGESLEIFLDRPISVIGAGAKVITLHEAAGMHLLPNRKAGLWAGAETEVRRDDHGHDHDTYDMHIWLDPGNADRIVDVIARALARIDPNRAEIYLNNAMAMQERMKTETEILRQYLTPVRDRAFIVFHDAYRYFEQAFGLNGVGAVAVNPARPPGAKRLTELRRNLIRLDVRCVFTEPQFEPDLVHTVIEGTGVRSASLDPLGADLDPGVDAWFQIMRGLGNAFVDCLGTQ